MIKFAAVFAVIVSVLLAGCGPVYSTHYSYIPPKSFRARRCANRCLQQKSYCETNCNISDQSCRMEANAEAEPAYRAYIRHERRAGRVPLQTIGDFADYSNCGGDCGCADMYNQCFTNCGGEVIANRVCTAFCSHATP